MKYPHYALLFLAAAVFSCTRHSYPRQLVEADSLCSVSPDSALSILDNMRPAASEMRDYARFYYRLLRVKAADKAYIKHTSADEIDEILHYYENVGDSRLLPEAYFYAGSVYRDLNDAPQAVEYYQKALECMPEDEVRMRSNTYNQLGHLFIDQGLADMAICAYKEAYKMDLYQKDTANIIYSLRDLGYAYNKRGDMDSCEQVCKRAVDIAVRSGNKKCINSLYGQIAGILSKNGCYVEALAYLNRCDISSKSIDKSADYAIAARIYMGLKQYDKAQTCCDSLLTFGTVYARKSACRYLIKICSEKKGYARIASYTDLYEQYCDSVDNISSRETVARIHALFDYNQRTQEISRLKHEEAWHIIIFISVLLLMVLCTCAILYILYKTRRRSERQKALFYRLRRYQYERTCEYKNANRQEIINLEHQISLYKDKNSELSALLEEQRSKLIAANEKSEADIKDEISSINLIHESSIYRILLSRIKEQRPLSGAELDELDTVVNACVTDFKKRLYAVHSMSAHEYNICLLIKAGICIKDIAPLLGRGLSSITMARKRLYAKTLGKEGSPSDFDNFVKSL